jgi:hypothetical protein
MHAAYTNASANSSARPLVPITPCTGVSLLEGELAARAPGLRAPAILCPPQGTPLSVPVARFKPSRTDPLNREPPTPGPTVPFKPFRTDPLNREPTAKPGSTVAFKPSRNDLLHLIPPRRRPSTATRAAATAARAVG